MTAAWDAMDAIWKITEADRDVAGKVEVNSATPVEPRSLADLLPKPEAIKQEPSCSPGRIMSWPD